MTKSKTKYVVSAKQGSASSTRAPKIHKKKPLRYKSLKLSKKIKPQHSLPKARTLFSYALGQLLRYRRVFGGIIAIYGLLYLVLVQSGGLTISGSELKASLRDLTDGGLSTFLEGISLFAALIASGNTSADQTSNVYQSILFLVFSLAIVWTLRQHYGRSDKVRLRIRDSFYKGMTPLVPVTLIFLLGVIQIIPAALGLNAYSLLKDLELASTGVEQIICLLLALLLVLLSVYMMVSTVIALYIAALPGTEPRKALRAAKQLVANRRFEVLRRFIVLPIFMVLSFGLIMIPTIMWAEALVAPLFFILNVSGIVIFHAYAYKLYRELL